MHTHSACRVCRKRFVCDGSGCDQPSDAELGPVCRSCSRSLCEAEERKCYLCVEEEASEGIRSHAD